jgi:hypothetical protein
MTRLAALLALALVPSVARANAPGFPGTHRIPADVVIEADREYPEFVFILNTWQRVEILKVAPGRPYHLPADWGGESPHAMLHAVPAREFDGKTDEQIVRAWTERRQGAGVPSPMAMVDFVEGVWFYDTRRNVVNTYRITDGGAWPRMTLVHTTPERTGAKVTRYAVGVFLAAAAVLLGRRLFRRKPDPASA